jgi:nucleotide-binding universal stress UspA family protein
MSREPSAARNPRPAAKAEGVPSVEPSVIVGYDGSPEARHAALWAARRAAPRGKLVLIHASRLRHSWLPGELLTTESERKDRGRALIDELLMDGDEALLEVTLEAHVVDDTPADALIGAAERHHAREIVVGSHHRTSADVLHGDVAAELVRTTAVPVCVVPLEGEPQLHAAPRANAAG